MSRENVEVVRRMFDAFRNADWAVAAEPLHPDIEMDTTRAPISELAGVYKGREEVAGFWLGWLDAWGAQSYDDPELIDAGDQVLSWVTGHHLRGRGSGVEVGFPPYAWVLSLRGGEIVQATMYMDKREALEAAGLSE
jgi:ketosteroid isomerase-like protein